MAKGKRKERKRFEAEINSFVQYVEDGYHGLTAVYNRKMKAIVVYPRMGYAMATHQAIELLSLYLSEKDLAADTAITFSGSVSRHQAVFPVSRARRTGLDKKRRCSGCGAGVHGHNNGSCDCGS